MVFFRDIYELQFLKIIFVDFENKFGYILLPVLVNNFTKFKDHPLNKIGEKSPLKWPLSAFRGVCGVYTNSPFRGCLKRLVPNSSTMALRGGTWDGTYFVPKFRPTMPLETSLVPVFL